MKFSCESNDLAYALNKCASLARPSRTHPVARNVLLEADTGIVRIYATDVVSAYVVYIVNDVEVTESGTALVDAGSFSTFVNAITGTVKVRTIEKGRYTGRLEVKIGMREIRLSQDTHHLPVLPVPDGLEPVMTIRGDELSDLLGISFMADRGDLIAALSGTYLYAKDNVLMAIAASSFRFASASLPTDYSKTSMFLLPASTGRLLPYYLHDDDTVSIHANEKHMWFVTNRFNFACNSINAKYPYQIIANVLREEKPNRVSVNKYELENAIATCKQLSDVTNVTGKRVVFLIDSEYGSNKGTITISTSAENEIGDMEWTIMTDSYEGESFSFAINVDYLGDILTALNKLAKSGILADFDGTNSVNISAGEDANKSAIFFSSNTKNSVFAILPMRV